MRPQQRPASSFLISVPAISTTPRSFLAAILLLFAVPPVRKHGPVIARAPAAAI